MVMRMAMVIVVVTIIMTIKCVENLAKGWPVEHLGKGNEDKDDNCDDGDEEGDLNGEWN